MAPKLIRTLTIFTLIFAALLAFPAAPAHAESSTLADAAFPTLATFTNWVTNGQANQLRGVYIQDILADSVVQQPANQADFVSPRQNIITQFGVASAVGSTGLLAHNTLAGAKFTLLQYGQLVYLVYGDGRIAAYVVTQVLQYQALQPNSPYSNFVDLSSGRSISSSALFSIAYGRPGTLVLQTCIAANGVASWGRLFIIAEPYIPTSSLLPASRSIRRM